MKNSKIRIKNGGGYKCSVLVNSCDAYEDTWVPFFRLLRKNWGDLSFPIYLNTESKGFDCDFLKVTTINCNSDISWSGRLMRALKKIKTKYVLMFLDDFFLQNKVDQERFDSILEILEKNKQIANFSFMPILKYMPKDPNSLLYDGFYRREKDMKYILTTQCAVWRKKSLCRFLSKYESAWQFEQYGSERAKLYNDEFYIAKPGNKIFDYHYSIDDGYGICSGKWLNNTATLFCKNGITVDFDKRGFFDGNDTNAEVAFPRKSFRWKWRYFIYGGCDNYFTPINKQLKLAFIHPRTYMGYLKEKIDFVLH